MMSLHRATHSSQMKTRGPEISLRTSRRRFPQKEQWKSSIKEEYCTRFAPRQAPPSALLAEHPSAPDFRNLPLIFVRTWTRDAQLPPQALTDSVSRACAPSSSPRI